MAGLYVINPTCNSYRSATGIHSTAGVYISLIHTA
nr:MAG TPA: hypothetical protein [Caudoviricetes sp.]